MARMWGPAAQRGRSGAIGTRLLHPRATYWPHSGPATSQESQVPDPKGTTGKSSGDRGQPGPEVPSAGVELPSGWGEGRAIPPENEGRVSVSRAPSGLPRPLPQEVAPARPRPLQQSGARAAPPSHLTSPRARPPAQAQLRGGGRDARAGGGVAQPCPQAHGGGRRRFWPSSSPAPAGPAPLPPRAPYAQPARPRAQAPRPHSPPRFAPAPHASGPPRGRGGDEVRVGAGE